MRNIIGISVMLLTFAIYQIAISDHSDEFEFFWEGVSPITTLNLGE